MNVRNTFSACRAFVARQVNPIAAALSLVAVSGVASAQATAGGTLDVSSVTAEITEGLAAMAVIGAAWVGFKYLKKVWNKL